MEQNETAQRTIFITGCSGGIGYCVVHGLTRRGYPVIASARKPEDVERLTSEGSDCPQVDLDAPQFNRS